METIRILKFEGKQYATIAYGMKNGVPVYRLTYPKSLRFEKETQKRYTKTFDKFESARRYTTHNAWYPTGAMWEKTVAAKRLGV